jgi:hypothetical protein
MRLRSSTHEPCPPRAPRRKARRSGGGSSGGGGRVCTHPRTRLATPCPASSTPRHNLPVYGAEAASMGKWGKHGHMLGVSQAAGRHPGPPTIRAPTHQ